MVGEINIAGFAGSRQPKGLAEAGRQRLVAVGHLPDAVAAEAPPLDDAVGAGSAAADQIAAQASAEQAPMTASSRGMKRPRARRARPEFVLPPRNAAKASARSCHFRLPAEIEAKLAELAEEHGCSKTHVVCAAIESAWTRLDRERRRGPG